jgi:hypothetical protein
MVSIWSKTNSLGFRAGELVEVRSMNEILATLDKSGKLDGMPFMPEMVQYCGQQFRVFKAAHKTCDRAGGTGAIQRVTQAVHLEGLRCDGTAHDGCDAGCLLFWKEAWLKPVAPATMNGKRRSKITSGTECTIEDLHAAVQCGNKDGHQRYSCQATEQLRFSSHMSAWDLRQYARDLWSGNVRIHSMLWFLLVKLFNNIQRYRQGRRFPNIYGTQTKSPKQVLDLKPGDLVEIKSLPEIRNTLHIDEHNRGLSFDREMVKFCGRQVRVLKRVEKIIDERTGQMVQMKADCIMLDGVTCEGDYHGFCPRGIFPYWREIWLRKVEQLR